MRDRLAAGIIQGRIARLKFGHLGDYKSVGKGFLSSVSTLAPDIAFIEGDRVVILLVGGDKKTQPMDIKRAQKYWQNFKARNV